MEESNHNATSSSSPIESYGSVSSPSSSLQDRDEEVGVTELPFMVDHQTDFAYDGHFNQINDDDSRLVREDSWSDILVALTFSFFVSMILMMGVYGSETLRLGPYCSLLVQINPLFVQYIKVEQMNETKAGPSLYGFHKAPLPDVTKTWSETYNVSLPPRVHKEWVHILNEGSQINVSYSVTSTRSSPLILIIAEGSEGFAKWLEDRSYPNSTLSWNVIRGSGVIQLDILKSSSYYVAVGNLKSKEIEVHLKLNVKGVLYNNTESYYTCHVAPGSCRLEVPFPHGNAALLTSPGPEQGIAMDEWYVRLSYGPRLITYFIGLGGMTVLFLLVFHLNKGTRGQFEEMGPERTPLLSNKDDDLTSRGSSYDSVLQDDEDPEDRLAVGSFEKKPVNDSEYNSNGRHLCAICFDAPRDCFFLPCGHCVSCFACGTRILEMAGTCPICRRITKKVRKIYTV